MKIEKVVFTYLFKDTIGHAKKQDFFKAKYSFKGCWSNGTGQTFFGANIKLNYT